MDPHCRRSYITSPPARAMRPGGARVVGLIVSSVFGVRVWGRLPRGRTTWRRKDNTRQRGHLHLHYQAHPHHHHFQLYDTVVRNTHNEKDDDNAPHTHLTPAHTPAQKKAISRSGWGTRLPLPLPSLACHPSPPTRCLKPREEHHLFKKGGSRGQARVKEKGGVLRREICCCPTPDTSSLGDHPSR